MEVSKEIKERNRKLCEKYPFLIPRNDFSGMRITEAQNGGFWPREPEAIPEYDYEYTNLDEMPNGWRRAFGEQICDEIKDALLEGGGEDLLNEYYPVQIKEKFGGLRWYGNVDPTGVDEVISKYEEISMRTCIKCGKPATRISMGWISPFCDKCIRTTAKYGGTNPDELDKYSWDINKYYKTEKEYDER